MGGAERFPSITLCWVCVIVVGVSLLPRLAVPKEDMTCVKIRYAEVLVARGKRGFAGGKQSDAALRSSLAGRGAEDPTQH